MILFWAEHPESQRISACRVNYYPRCIARVDRLIKAFNFDPKKKIKNVKRHAEHADHHHRLACRVITMLDEPVAGLDVVAREDFYKLPA